MQAACNFKFSRDIKTRRCVDGCADALHEEFSFPNANKSNNRCVDNFYAMIWEVVMVMIMIGDTAGLQSARPPLHTPKVPRSAHVRADFFQAFGQSMQGPKQPYP